MKLFRKYCRELLILGMFLSLLSSVVLTFGALPSDEQIDKITSTSFDQNLSLKKDLKKNRFWTEIGLLLLISGFSFQFLGILGDNKKS